jgi:hypothetical protein
MGLNANEPIWTAAAPAAWPDPPPEMTVTALGGIESCPRRWALGAAHYPELWSGRGYPPRVQLGALSGTVVHLALEVITRALTKAGGPSLEDPAAFGVMKSLGGYTTVVNDCIDRALEHLVSSPRAQPMLEYSGRWLRAQVPELRTRVQTMLCRLRLPRLHSRSVESRTRRVRGPLTVGAFSELNLRAEGLGWKGKVDLLVLSHEACEITDFKTGAPDEEHQFQIFVYALLWSRDAELNPGRRCADRLLLAYGEGDVEVVPPSEADLDDLERLVTARTTAARVALAKRPPEAKPAPQQCLYCDVRHMCSEYWSDETQHLMRPTLENRHLVDATLAITARHGSSSWDALIVSSAIAKQDQRVLLRSGDRSVSVVPGQILRVLSAHVATMPEEDESESVLIFTLGASSEVFLAP